MHSQRRRHASSTQQLSHGAHGAGPGSCEPVGVGHIGVDALGQIAPRHVSESWTRARSLHSQRSQPIGTYRTGWVPALHSQRRAHSGGGDVWQVSQLSAIAYDPNARGQLPFVGRSVSTPRATRSGRAEDSVYQAFGTPAGPPSPRFSSRQRAVAEPIIIASVVHAKSKPQPAHDPPHEPALALPAQLQFAPLASCAEHAGFTVAFHVQVAASASIARKILRSAAAAVCLRCGNKTNL